MRKLFYILSFAFLLLSVSCADKVDYRNNDVPQLYLEVRLEPAAEPLATLRSTEVINDINQDVFLASNDDATIILSSSEDNLSRVFVYQDGHEAYAINNPFLIKEGREYNVSATINDRPELGEVTGSTIVPFPNTIESIQHVSTTSVPQEEDFDKRRLEFDVKITDSDHKYYLIEPYADVFRYDALTGAYNDARLPRDWFESFRTDHSSAHAVETLAHRDGVLINTDLLDNNTATISFASVNILDAEYDSFLSVYFNLHTVSEGFYFHNLTYSKQVKASDNGVAQPVTSYTNIDGGQGAITSFSTSRDTFFFQ